MTNERLLMATARTPRVSEAWLTSHAQAMSEDIVATATYEAADGPWFGQVPNYSFEHPASLGRYGLGKLLRARHHQMPAELRSDELTGAVVHTATLYDLLSPPGGPLGDLPTAVYVHGMDITWSPFRWCPVPYKHLGNTQAYIRRLIEYSERVVFIANSKLSRDRLIDAGMAPDRIHVCYLPVTRRSPKVAPKSVVSRTLELLYIGRFIGCKGPLEVVRAVDIARRMGADVRLTMIGDGELYEPVTQLVETLQLQEDVRLLGAVPNEIAMNTLADSDALILHNQVDAKTGQVEAFGYAHAEALSLGVPVLTGAVGGPTEFLVDRENSLLVEAGDVQSQGEQICEISNDDELLIDLSDGAQSTASKLFCASAHRQAVLDALRSASR